MTTLWRRRHRVDTVFDLLGTSEDDMTASLGFALSRSPELLGLVISDLLDGATPDLAHARIELQRHHGEHGITDVELVIPGHLL